MIKYLLLQFMNVADGDLSYTINEIDPGHFDNLTN